MEGLPKAWDHWTLLRSYVFGAKSWRHLVPGTQRNSALWKGTLPGKASTLEATAFAHESVPLVRKGHIGSGGRYDWKDCILSRSTPNLLVDGSCPGHPSSEVLFISFLLGKPSTFTSFSQMIYFIILRQDFMCPRLISNSSRGPGWPLTDFPASTSSQRC